MDSWSLLLRNKSQLIAVLCLMLPLIAFNAAPYAQEPGMKPPLDLNTWQYLIMGSTKDKVEKPSDIESCQSCHSAWALKSDFVSRAYLSPQQNQNLR